LFSFELCTIWLWSLQSVLVLVLCSCDHFSAFLFSVFELLRCRIACCAVVSRVILVHFFRRAVFGLLRCCGASYEETEKMLECYCHGLDIVHPYYIDLSPLTPTHPHVWSSKRTFVLRMSSMSFFPINNDLHQRLSLNIHLDWGLIII